MNVPNQMTDNDLNAAIAQELYGWPLLSAWKDGDFYEAAKRLGNEHGVDVVWTQREGEDGMPWRISMCSGVTTSPDYRYASDPSLSLALIEKAREKGVLIDLKAGYFDWRIEWGPYPGGHRTGLAFDKLPRAICECILSALRASPPAR